MLKFRTLTDNDFPLIEAWLKKEHVRRWYEIPEMGITIEDWIAEIHDYKGEFKWITYLIVLLENKPIGMCLYYKCEDSEGEEFGSLPMEGSYGIDYFIGEEDLLGQGIGKQIISLLVQRIMQLPDTKRVTADTDKNNIISQKTLLACGFSLLEKGSGRYFLE